MAIHNGAHARVEGDASQIFEPRYAHTFETAVGRTREMFAGFGDGERGARVRGRDCTEHEGQVSYGTAQASGGAERRPSECRFRVRHAADRRTKTDYVAECGGI